jgi:hypothetical protein
MEKKLQLQTNIKFINILGHLWIWFFLTIFTLGTALYFYPYYFFKFAINKTYFVTNDGIEKKLVCELSVLSKIGYILMWIIITLLTVGIGYPFYLYKVWSYCIKKTRIIDDTYTPLN